MAQYTTSNIVTEISPNSDIVELIVITPATAGSGTVCTITLSDYGISEAGLLTVQGFTQSTEAAVVVKEEITTSVSTGTLTITSGTGTGKKIYRILGKGA
jgi:hypothetical protein